MGNVAGGDDRAHGWVVAIAVLCQGILAIKRVFRDLRVECRDYVAITGDNTIWVQEMQSLIIWSGINEVSHAFLKSCTGSSSLYKSVN